MPARASLNSGKPEPLKRFVALMKRNLRNGPRAHHALVLLAYRYGSK